MNPETSSASHNLADGTMREMCICPEGFTGLTCLHHVAKMEHCRSYNGQRYCLNGGICRQIMSSKSDDEWRCDCIEADGISPFAGHMCRKPHTEYCNDEGTAFCTNGGTCKNNLVSQTIRLEYSGSDSCVCPKEFSGPHCEFLNELVAINKLTLQEKIDETFGPAGLIGKNNPTTDGRETLFITLGFGMFLVLCALATVFVSRNKRYGELRRDENESCGIVPCSDIPNAEQFVDDDEGYKMQDVAL